MVRYYGGVKSSRLGSAFLLFGEPAGDLLRGDTMYSAFFSTRMKKKSLQGLVQNWNLERGDCVKYGAKFNLNGVM